MSLLLAARGRLAPVAASFAAVAAMVALALSACGQSSAAPAPHGCPSKPPTAGTTCDPAVEPYCDYGGDAFGRCVIRAECDAPANTWKVTEPPAGCGKNASACPAVFGDGLGGPCPTQSTCEYAGGDGGLCGCTTCKTEGGAEQIGIWVCAGAVTVGEGCPAKRPLAGTSCTGAAQCAYWGCCNDLAPEAAGDLVCQGGKWTYASVCGCGPRPACP